MTIGSELFSFALYVAQEAGVSLGVGAEMVLLVAYLLYIHTPGKDQGSYLRAARFTERVALGLILLSGLGIVAFHATLGQLPTLLAPAFIAKWALILLVLIGYKLEPFIDVRRLRQRTWVHGFFGGTWFALFLLHITAPETTMLVLAVGYAAWMAFFGVLWAGFVFALSHPAMPRLPKMIKIPKQPAPKLSELPKVVPAASPERIAVIAVAPPPKIVPPETPKLPVPVVAAVAPPVVVMSAAPTPAPLPKIPAAPPVVAKAAQLPDVYKVELAAPAPTVHVQPAPAPRKPVVAATPAPRPIAPPPSPPTEGLPAIRVMPRTPEQVQFA